MVVFSRGRGTFYVPKLVRGRLEGRPRKFLEKEKEEKEASEEKEGDAEHGHGQQG